MALKNIKPKISIAPVFRSKWYLFLTLLHFLPSVSNSQTVVQTESFEGTIFPAPGWRHLKSGTGINAAFTRQAVATAVNPTITAAPGGGTNVMMLNSFSAGAPASPDTTFMVSKPFDFSNNGGVNPSFSFYMYRDGGFLTNDDNIRVYINTAPSVTGATLLTNASGTSVIYRRINAFPVATTGWHQQTYNLPAATYNQRRYYIIIVGVAMDGNNLYIDNFQTTTYPSATNAADVSLNIFTQNLATVGSGFVDHMVVGVRCIVGGTSGCGVIGSTVTAVKLDSLLFNTNGTSSVSDIQNAKIWYTGGSNIFSTGYVSPYPATTGVEDYPSSRFGQTIANPATNLDFMNGITSCFYLEYDTTYFWLTYDLRPTAVGGNFVDADFRGAAVGGTGGCPSTGGTGQKIVPGSNGYSLTGSSKIDLPYCVPSYAVGTSWANYTNNDYLQSVVLNGALGTVINTNVQGGMPYPSNNNAGLPTSLACYPFCDFTANPPSYELWSSVVARTVIMNQGANYTVTVQAGTWISNNNIAVWIDFNRNGSFLDAGEYLGGANLLANASAPVNFTVPAAGYVGPTRMRVREVYATNFANISPCSNYTYGETEDFAIVIAPNCPSAAYKLWLGNTDDWNNPANWCGGVPTITDSAVVSRALVPGLTTNPRPYFKPVIKSNVLANANSLFISDQDTLTINAPTPSANPLKIRSNLINNGLVQVVSTGNGSLAIPFNTGTLSNSIYTPFKAASSDARTQIIYSATELAAAGILANDRITGLLFNITSKGSTMSYQNFTISYAFVPITQHASNVPFAGPFTNAYGPVSINTVLGLNTINLTTPITWDGTSNLLIQYCFDNVAPLGSSDDRISITQTTGIASTLILSTSINAGSGCSLLSGAGITDNNFNNNKSDRPNFIFLIETRYSRPFITVQRNWINNGRFDAGNCQVVMDSIQPQLIGGSNPTTFHELRLNKGAVNQTVTLQQRITVADTLLLDAGSLLLNGNTLTIGNNGVSNGTLTAPTGPITRTGGFIFSESANLLPSISYVRWNVGTTAGWRVIPFGDTLTAAPVYIPFTFRHVTGALDTFSVATYRTPANNLPYPPTVGHVNLYSGGNNSANVVNRFWMTDKTSPGNPVTDLTFRWSDAENSVGQSGFNLPRAQPYKFIAGTPNYEAWLRITNTNPAPPAGSLLGTAVSYAQTTTILNGAADSTRVLAWNWPSLVSPAVPFGNYIPWALSNNNSPLGAFNQSEPLLVSFTSVIKESCSGNSDGTLGITVTGGTVPYNYLWSNGATTLTISGLSAGNYTVTVTDLSGQSSSGSMTVGVDNIIPQSPGLITGEVSVCPPCTRPYAVSPVNGATGYQWSVPANATLTAGQVSNNVQISFSPGFVSGQLCATATNACGSSPPSCSSLQSNLFSATTKMVSCFGGSDGAINLNISCDTLLPNNPGLLISEFHTDPPLNDSPLEWVELKAVRNIDFSVTPFTVIFANNGTATSKGWMQGGAPTPPPRNSTYAFELTSGSVTSGDVVYVGGSGMTPNVNRLRVLNTSVTNGDGGIGSPFLSSGVLGNGGGVADGIAVFNKPASQIDSNTVPVDAIFFGSGVGDAALADTLLGFTLPVNDRYAGGRLKSSSFMAPEILGSYSIRASGHFNVPAGTYDVPRVWTVNQTVWTSPVSSVTAGANSFLWSNGANTRQISGLTAGVYTLTITSADGITAQSVYTITQPSALTVTTSLVNNICYGDADGGITLSVSGGIQPYSFNWSNGSSLQNQTGLIAGNYMATVTDSAGCTNQINVTISQPSQLLSTIQKNDVSCNGDINGTATALVSGGTPPYSYIWTNGSTVASISGLAPGNYALTVTDASGCIVSDSVSVLQLSTLNLSLSAVDATCYGSSDAVIAATVNGGTTPYSYVWSTGAVSSQVNNLPAGIYTVSVTDADNCVVSSTVTVSQPAVLSGSLTSDSVSCYAGSDGSITSFIAGGTPPYSYQWSTGSTAFSIVNRPAGIYTLTVTDSKGCSTAVSKNILQPIPVSISFNIIPASCPAASNGVISSNVSGGSPPYSYNWSSVGYGPERSGLPAGNYSLSVTDALGCTLNQSVTMTAGSNFPVAVLSAGPVICNGASTGYINSQVAGGIPPYAYSWSSGSTQSALVNSPSGTYTMTVTDAAGCSSQSQAVISQSAPIIVNSFTPSSNNAGYPVVLKGYNLAGASSVKFGTVDAGSITVSGDTMITAIVPAGAISGPISVFHPNGCNGATSTSFTVLNFFTNLSLKLFIQGIYAGGGYMNLPLVNSGLSGNSQQADSLTVSVYSTTDLSAPMYSRKTILATTGLAMINLPGNLVGDSFWITIRHRNSIETWSRLPVIFSASTFYDFSIGYQPLLVPGY